jgi:hypothetical protein
MTAKESTTLLPGSVTQNHISLPAHAHVRNPKELLREKHSRKKRDNKVLYYNDAVLEWVTDHVLGSVLLFDIALTVPLLVIPAPESIKITLGVVSGSWIQWWALPALQRSQNETQAQNDAKAEADHETLTYLATTQDEQSEMIKKIVHYLSDPKNN